MTYTISSSDIALLRRAGVSEDDITHSVLVAEKALEITRRIGGSGIDQELVGRGALFHDLGKCRTHEMEHGRIGAELGGKIGLPQDICDIMEKHIRGGLTEPEARELKPADQGLHAQAARGADRDLCRPAGGHHL